MNKALQKILQDKSARSPEAAKMASIESADGAGPWIN